MKLDWKETHYHPLFVHKYLIEQWFGDCIEAGEPFHVEMHLHCHILLGISALNNPNAGVTSLIFCAHDDVINYLNAEIVLKFVTAN